MTRAQVFTIYSAYDTPLHFPHSVSMQHSTTTMTLFSILASVSATSSPIPKVLSMISDLEAKIMKEGDAALKEYQEFAEFCEDRARQIGFDIKTGTSEYDSFKAAIAKESATISELESKVDDLASSIASDEADLKAATDIRTSEAKHFEVEEKELMETIDMLHRASSIIERQMQGGAAMMQLKNVGNVAQAFQVMVQASLIGTSDASRLTAFVQDSSKQGDQDEDDDAGAPAGEVYKSQSGGILDTLQDLADKAENQLADLRKKETAEQHNFDRLRQSLLDDIRFSNKDMAEGKTGISASSEKRSDATGELWATGKALSEDEKSMVTLRQSCKTNSAKFDAESKSRAEELKALASAKSVLKEATGAALNQVALLQVGSQLYSSRDLVKFEAVRYIRDLARKEHSNSLAQLATQMDSAMHSSDPFEKVKGLITSMIAKLEQEADADATKKAYCDKELAESNAKQADKTDEIAKLSTRIEEMTAQSAKLKEEIATLEQDLGALAKAQAEMDKLRQEQKGAYEDSKAEYEKGLTGIKAAIRILKEYYGREDAAHDAADGAAGGIIGLLEVVEADFTKTLEQMSVDEQTAVNEYEKVTKENEIQKTSLEQDVKYKVKDSKYLDKTSAELNADRSGVQSELDAVVEYLNKIKEQCIAKAETYADRTARRAAELAGLKDALRILESETALVQSSWRRSHRRTFLGALKP